MSGFRTTRELRAEVERLNKLNARYRREAATAQKQLLDAHSAIVTLQDLVGETRDRWADRFCQWLRAK